MTRLELLTVAVGRARTNGFEFRHWYTGRLGLPWISVEASLVLLDAQRRYYALVFSHEFAQNFWKPGTELTFELPPVTFQRTMADGSRRTITRRAFVRRSTRANAWRYHLRQMALAEEPLRYLRRYMRVAEDEESGFEEASTATASLLSAAVRPQNRNQRGIRQPTDEIPAFLKRPYRPAAK